MSKWLTVTIGNSSILKVLVFYSNFAFSDVVVKADTTQKLLKLDPLKKEYHKPCDYIDVSTGAKLHVTKYKQGKNHKSSTVKAFYDGAVRLLSNVVRHMMEKCPLKNQLIRCASCLDPTKLAINDLNSASKSKFSKMVEKLTVLDQITVKTADDSKE